jgi:hypothetical protein
MHCWQSVVSQERDLVLLQPTGELFNGLVEMEVIHDTSILAKKTREIVASSVIKDFLQIHKILQVYLFNTRGKPMEPAYLALTQNQGGYAREGFAIMSHGDHLVKPESFYVDVNENTLDRDFRSLMSITQLYPHELGHVMYRLLSSSDTIEASSKNINVHFFSVTTDYLIAFNEGFAEHMENIARLFEDNQEVVGGITTDSAEVVRKSRRVIRGFRRDFEHPLRFGFYKMSMLGWYQQFEDYKRFAYPLHGLAKYANASISTRNVQSNLIYRNAGVDFDTSTLLNVVQQMSTEGPISSFFTQLSLTGLKDRYQAKIFYQPFVEDTSSLVVPVQVFTPLENLFIKYFYVLDRYVTFEKTEKSHLIDFIDGYLSTFPDEREEVLQAFETATGLEYHNEVPPQVWLLVKNRSHGIMAMDAFAGLSMPFYTFELNAAEREDLMMIQGVSESDAEAILNFRETHGFFRSLNDLEGVADLGDESRQAVMSSKFDQSYFDAQEFPEGLSIRSVLIAPLQRLILYSLISFTLISFLYFFLTRNEVRSLKKRFGEATGYLIIWIILVLYGLITAAMSWHWAPVLALALVVLAGIALIRRKMVLKHLIVITLMAVISLYSLI